MAQDAVRVMDETSPCITGLYILISLALETLLVLVIALAGRDLTIHETKQSLNDLQSGSALLPQWEHTERADPLAII